MLVSSACTLATSGNPSATSIARRILCTSIQADLQLPRPRWLWSCKADIPFECEVIRYSARCRLLSGTC